MKFKKSKKDPRFQDLDKPDELKGKCPVCSADLVNVGEGQKRFLVHGDHYKIEAVLFEKLWQKFLTEQGDGDELMISLLDNNVAPNIEPMKLLKVRLINGLE